MDASYCIEDLPADRLKAVLSAPVEAVSHRQLLAVEQFVRRVGGIENAYLAAALLTAMEEPA